ncbi:carbohydrate esterase family 4 protein [Ceratobasidium sp. AG-I]|nr:carbohydrate esterase family 4 protein [Ceratobasidium sp. AG-I]
MSFTIVRLAVITAALLGAINVSAAPVEHELETRALAKVITKCTQAKTVALTFDDGPYTSNKKLVDLLDKNDAKGTFFFNGDNYGCIYDSANAARVKYAYDKGHQVASHTWRHAHLKTLSGSTLEAEFTKTNTALQKITGAVPAFMRQVTLSLRTSFLNLQFNFSPPYGEYDNEVRKVAAKYGQSVVIWDFDSGDSAGKSASQSKKDYKNLIAKKPKNVLTLNHETYATTIDDVIPYAIKQFKAKGYKLVTVAECLGQSPYQSTRSPTPRDSTWKC